MVGFVLVLDAVLHRAHERHRPAHRRGLQHALVSLHARPRRRGDGDLARRALRERRAGGELQAQNLYEAFGRPSSDSATTSPCAAATTVPITWNELRGRVGAIAGGLASLGVRKGDTVALMLNNRPEFVRLDLAAVALGAVPFSIYQTSSPEQIATSSPTRAPGSRSSSPRSSRPSSEAREELPGIEHADRARRRGRRPRPSRARGARPGLRPAEPPRAVEPDDLLTLIYTSGTTGPPKGVQLTHRNLMSLVAGVDA